MDIPSPESAPAALADLIVAGLVTHEMIGDPGRLAGEAAALEALCGLVSGSVWRIEPFHYAFRVAPGDLAGAGDGLGVDAQASALEGALQAALGADAVWVNAADLAPTALRGASAGPGAAEGPLADAPLLLLHAGDAARGVVLEVAGPDVQAVIGARFALAAARLAAARERAGSPSGSPVEARQAAILATLEAAEERSGARGRAGGRARPPRRGDHRPRRPHRHRGGTVGGHGRGDGGNHGRDDGHDRDRGGRDDARDRRPARRARHLPGDGRARPRRVPRRARAAHRGADVAPGSAVQLTMAPDDLSPRGDLALPETAPQGPRQTLAMRLAARNRQRELRAERLARLHPPGPAGSAARIPRRSPKPGPEAGSEAPAPAALDAAEVALEDFLRTLTGDLPPLPEGPPVEPGELLSFQRPAEAATRTGGPRAPARPATSTACPGSARG